MSFILVPITVSLMTDQLFSFLKQSPTPFHAASAVSAQLREAGFIELNLKERLPLPLPPRIFVRTAGAVFAIDVRGVLLEHGVTILAAHTDSPALKIKVHGIREKAGAVLAPTEVYGGPIRATWLDQPLGIAGAVHLEHGLSREFVLESTVIIPNLAIHLNRQVNEGYEYNPQEHLTAIIGLPADGNDPGPGASERFLSRVAAAAEVEREQISEIDAYLFDAASPQRAGLSQELYLVSRIDNLAGCFCNLSAFLSSSGSRPAMLALYNHEEIGSRSAEGALSNVLSTILDRTLRAHGLDEEDREVVRQKSLLVSNDATHAMHPNFPGKYDEHYACSLNGGPVIKYSASYRYATTGPTAALFQSACNAQGIPVQRFVTRSDMRSGSTVGPLGWAQTGIASLDVGLPIWAMHSIRETGGVKDLELMTGALSGLLSRS